MKPLLIALFCVLGLAPGGARADPAPPSIPATFYPAGSRIDFSVDYSNTRMDAEWNFDANGEPLMHSLHQDILLRQSGWMEQSFVQHGNQIAWFILYDSTYGSYLNGRLGNTGAYVNLQHMLTVWWHAGLATHQPANVIPAGATGSFEARVIPKLDDGPFLVMSAWWGSSREIEAIAFSTPHLIGRTKLRQMLAAQVRYAVGLS
ncbi:MAG TPA: hypothetical protein VF221_10650 [Chloroflexota bacterium]